jgi:hypothetical protein
MNDPRSETATLSRGFRGHPSSLTDGFRPVVSNKPAPSLPPSSTIGGGESTAPERRDSRRTRPGGVVEPQIHQILYLARSGRGERRGPDGASR